MKQKNWKMTIENNKNLIRQYINAVNTGKVDNMDGYVSPEYVESLFYRPFNQIFRHYFVK
jgi:hypothetical protein